MARPCVWIAILGLLGAGAAQAQAQTPAEIDAFCNTGCAGIPNIQACVARCKQSPAPKIAYTAQTAPIGTPIPLYAQTPMSPLLFPIDKNKPGITFMVESDVSLNGIPLFRKGTIAFGRWSGDACSPTIGMAIDNARGHQQGIALANVIQFVPLSLRNPNDPAGSEVAEVPTKACFLKEAHVTAYISGPPTEPTMLAAMAHAR